jgi:hypothetical protein
VTHHLAIDYLQDVPPTDTLAELIGTSFLSGTARISSIIVPATGRASVFVNLKGPLDQGSLTTVGYSETLKRTPSDTWTLSTDAYGKTVIFAKEFTLGGAKNRCLSISDNCKNDILHEAPVNPTRAQ